MSTENKNEGLSTKQAGVLKLDSKYTLGACVLLSVTGDIYHAQFTDKVNLGDSQLFIKFLPESYPHSAEAIALFSQEVDYVRGACNAFNIIAFEQSNESAYLIFELPQGAFLREKIAQKSIYGDLADVLSLISKIKKALDTLQNCGFLHGCVGMDSIYISDNDEVILLDSAYVSAKQRQLEKNIEHAETIPNREAIYASPDVCFGRVVSEQDNVFSLACISYHLLSGQHPFGGENSVAALLNKVRPKQINGLTDTQWQHLENGMAFAKESRLKTINDFIDGFDRAVSLKKKSIIAMNADKARETALARKQAKKILGTQGKKEPLHTKAKDNNKGRQIKPSLTIKTTTALNKSFSLDNFQLDLPEWAWIPLSLLSGILVGAIAMGVAIEFFGIRVF